MRTDGGNWSSAGPIIVVCVDSSDIENVRAIILDQLATGPMTLEELVAGLRSRAIPSALQELDDEELSIEIEEELLETDETWETIDGRIASSDVMLNGIHLSHRVTESELQEELLNAAPDFIPIDFNAFNCLVLDRGGDLEFRYVPGSDEDVRNHEVVFGPSGWLLEVAEPGTIVVLSRSGHVISLTKPTELGRGDVEQQALLEAFNAHYETGIAVELTDIVMDALARDASLFRSPVAPIGELLTRAGLEVDGDWVSRQGEEAVPPGVIYRERKLEALREKYSFDSCCRSALDQVFERWAEFTLHSDEGGDYRGVARSLAHSAVAPAFADYILGTGDHGSALLGDFARKVAQVGGKLAAPGHYLLALNSERDGRTLEAQEHLHAAVVADANYSPALHELAWFWSDRGDAVQAASLLQRSGGFASDSELEYIMSQLPERFVGVGRNDPCPCGSGRKFKSCCINGVKRGIEGRAGWLYHKIIAYLLRPQNQGNLVDLLEIAEEASEGAVPDSMLPVLADLAAFTRELLERFIAARGMLLPEDELALVRSWTDSKPSLHQAIDVKPGSSVGLLDVLSGEHVVVTEHSASKEIKVGDYVYARVVRVGETYQFIGLPLQVPLVHRAALIDILGAGADVYDLADWVGLMFVPPRIVNNEGEDTVFCRAVLRPVETSWEELSEALTWLFGEPVGGVWTERIEIDAMAVARSFVSREDDTLVITTTSVERFERVLARVMESVIDLEILEQTRTDPRQVSGQGDSVPAPRTTDETPPEVLEVLQNMMPEREDAWLDEAIPALAGMTPRQALTDPTRREDLIALLNEFDRLSKNAAPGSTFDVARLRSALGL